MNSDLTAARPDDSNVSLSQYTPLSESIGPISLPATARVIAIALQLLTVDRGHAAIEFGLNEGTLSSRPACAIFATIKIADNPTV